MNSAIFCRSPLVPHILFCSAAAIASGNCLAVLHQLLMILAVLQHACILLAAPLHRKGHGRGGGVLLQLCCGLFAAGVIITRLVNVRKRLFAQFLLSTSPPSDTAGSGSPAGCILLTAPLRLKGTEQLVLLQFVVWPVRSWKIITQSSPTPFISASGTHLSALEFSYYWYYYYYSIIIVVIIMAFLRAGGFWLLLFQQQPRTTNPAAVQTDHRQRQVWRSLGGHTPCAVTAAHLRSVLH